MSILLRIEEASVNRCNVRLCSRCECGHDLPNRSKTNFFDSAKMVELALGILLPHIETLFGSPQACFPMYL